MLLSSRTLLAEPGVLTHSLWAHLEGANEIQSLNLRKQLFLWWKEARMEKDVCLGKPEACIRVLVPSLVSLTEEEQRRDISSLACQLQTLRFTHTSHTHIHRHTWTMKHTHSFANSHASGKRSLSCCVWLDEAGWGWGTLGRRLVATLPAVSPSLMLTKLVDYPEPFFSTYSFYMSV